MRTLLDGNACIQSAFICSDSEKTNKQNGCLRLVLIFTLLLSFQFEPYPHPPSLSLSLFDSSCLHIVSCLQLYGQSQELTINVRNLASVMSIVIIISMLEIVQYLLVVLYTVSLFASSVEIHKRRSFDPCVILSV